MEERIKMLSDYDTGAFSVTQLSALYGVSRETFYAWRRSGPQVVHAFQINRGKGG